MKTAHCVKGTGVAPRESRYFRAGGLFLLLTTLPGCTTVQFPCGQKLCNYSRSWTNTAELHANIEINADGSMRARVDESKVDQTTAAAMALTAAAQLALKGAAP